MDRNELKERLTEFLHRKTDARSVDIQKLSSMIGGASQEAWALDVVLEDSNQARTKQELVVRIGEPSQSDFGDFEVDEFALLEAAYDHEVKVPRPYYRGDDSLCSPFYVMERIQGETLGHRLVHKDQYAEAREVIVQQMARHAARIHEIDPGRDNLDFLEIPDTTTSPAERELQRLVSIYDQVAENLDPHPAFELAFHWASNHSPDPNSLAVVHGDYRVGNIIFDEDGLKAILDWELAHVSDPVADLGWACVGAWRFGGQKPVGGIGDYDEFLEAYEEESGRSVDLQRLRFWEIFGELRWGIITMRQANRSLKDPETVDVELEAIGRRTAATEWRLLNKLEEW